MADDLIESICNYLPNYQESLKNLLEDGYEIVGYARKSPANDNIDNRTKLLQAMVNNLNDRSFARRIYVSTSSYSSTPFKERDLKNDDKSRPFSSKFLTNMGLKTSGNFFLS